MACGVGAEHFHVLDGHDVDNSKPSVHYTILFNAFVLMTLCNEVNCRKLEGEFNVFAGVCSNAWFVGVLLGTLVLQVLVQKIEPRHSNGPTTLSPPYLSPHSPCRCLLSNSVAVRSAARREGSPRISGSFAWVPASSRWCGSRR